MKRMLLLLCALACSAGNHASGASPDDAHATPAEAAKAHPDGIWKAAVPASAPKAEFDNHDAYGLAVGARILADCSLNWVDPDDGRRYCFASGTSLIYFLDAPKSNLASARATWQELGAAPR